MSSASPGTARPRRAPSTRAVLLAVLVFVVVALTGASLLIVWHRMRQQVKAEFTSELRRSVRAFQNAEAERLGALEREDALLADLPSLKALLTTNDDRTIQDAGADFWKTSGNDLFALAGPDRRVRAVYTARIAADRQLRDDLGEALKRGDRDYLVSAGHLFRYAVAPVYFGSASSGTLLGSVVSGYEIDTPYLMRLNSTVDGRGAFVSRGKVLASSLPLEPNVGLPVPQSKTPMEVSSLQMGGERYLATAEDLTPRATVPLQVIFFRSLKEPEQAIHDISRLLILVGASIVVLGSLLMVVVARRLTRPLEELARRVQTFGGGEPRSSAEPKGTQEVRQLAIDFEAMQRRIEDSNRARLESERLATIGSMATSVSHDLRHYLASIYANAEFLAASDATEEERAEFFQDIRTAVLGTTEMLESLTIFSRTGQAVRHVPEHMADLLGRAITQVRTHPAASEVLIETGTGSADAAVIADGKQVERALYNLLLNACQSPRPAARRPVVSARLETTADSIHVSIVDNGVGVATAVQRTLFDPFVSEGKQNGTGLGLTLSRCIAEEHRGSVELVSSSSEMTIFQFTLPRARPPVQRI